MTREERLERFGGVERLVESRTSHRLSSLVSRLNHFSANDGLSALDGLISGSRQYGEDQPAWAERGDLSQVCVLEEGWAYKFCFFPDGRRHIPEFFGPGSICNWSGFDHSVDDEDILFKAGSRVTLLDPRGFSSLLRSDSAISGAIMRHESARARRATQRVRAFISLSAEQKVLLLLLDIVSELDPWGSREEWHQMPFLQIEIADCLGITPVHVSRICVKLEHHGLMQRRENAFRLIDPHTIEDMLSYRDFFSPAPQPA